ncbi:hypothetical protein V5799_022137 [Amblyomma americanum]|uniref:Uncharacterized protein n=1 Tax=Amblyomma americanum TaxID=6943 RepID=A0AAQ4FLG1_AMBAM
MAMEQKESPSPVTDQPWHGSEPVSRPPEHPGILKTPAGLLEPPKPHPEKTLRFQAEPERTEEGQATPQAGCSGMADETWTVNSDSSDSSETSVGSATAPGSQSDSSSPGRPTSGPLRPRASSAPGTDSKAKVSPWLPKRMRRYFAALTRDKQGNQGKGKSSPNTATNGRNRERRSSHPSHRRRTGVAAGRYTGPPSQDDMRWRVALSRYALLTLLGSLTVLCLVIASLLFARAGGDALHDKQQTQDDGVIDGRRPAAWRALRTSAQSNALPAHELATKEGEGEPPLPPRAATEPGELVPSIGETPLIWRDAEQEEERSSIEDTGTSSLVPVRRQRVWSKN